MTTDIAKTLVGDTAVKGDLPAKQTSTKDVSISSCVYTARIDPSGGIKISNTKGVTVLIRAAKTSTGNGSNKSQFNTNRPSDMRDVDGPEDKEFFNPQLGQLNVLKGGNWYMIANYSGTAGNGTLAIDKQLADLLKLK